MIWGKMKDGRKCIIQTLARHLFGASGKDTVYTNVSIEGAPFQITRKDKLQD